MKNRRYMFVLLIAALFIFAAAVYSAEPVKESKETVTPTPSDRPALKEEAGFDIMLLIDSSGSMKKTDPKDYRKESARLFISLLSADDNVGVISFGDSAKTLIPLTKNSAGNRKALFAAAKKITSKELSTDITGAIKKGLSEFEASKKKDRILVLMSDGKLALGDPAKDEASTAELMKLLPELKAAGIKIYSIAFSDLSDPKLLGQIAEKTGGLFRYAKADKDIHIMFASIFEKIKSPDSVALQGDSFDMDKDVKEAVLLITKQSGTSTVLIDPAGKKSTKAKAPKNIQWFASAVFDMITIDAPMTGRWKVSLSSKEGNRIFVLTDLKLKTSFTATALKKGDKVVLDAWLEKDDKKIAESAVLGQVTFSAEVSAPAGNKVVVPLTAKPAPDAGIYAAEISVEQAGDYSVKLSAVGKTFNRAKQLHFNSVEPPQAAPPPASKPEPALVWEDILDWQLVSMICGAVIAVLLILIIALLLRARKYRRLYRVAARPEDKVPVQQTVEEPVEDRPEETESKQRADSARISKLLGVIDFQKSKIAELMQVKEVLESSRKKLGDLPVRSRLQHDRLKSLSESHGMADEAAKPLLSLEEDMGELVSYVLLLEKEEIRLVGKFREWEDNFKQLMEGEELSAQDIARIGEKLKEAQEQLKAKNAEVENLKKQMGSLDKEYMTLYHQQQAQEKAQQAIEEAQKSQGKT
jgi:Mg-chelatase subunit ChlD